MTEAQAGLRPFTAEWAAAFRDAIDASVAYRDAAQRWTWPLALVLDAAPALGYAGDTAILLDLDRGRCRSASVSTGVVTAPFVVRGEYDAWKQIIRGELDPIMAITRKRLRLKGSLATIMLHARSAKLLVGCAAAVPTSFPDERREVAP